MLSRLRRIQRWCDWSNSRCVCICMSVGLHIRVCLHTWPHIRAVILMLCCQAYTECTSLVILGHLHAYAIHESEVWRMGALSAYASLHQAHACKRLAISYIRTRTCTPTSAVHAFTHSAPVCMHACSAPWRMHAISSVTPAPQSLSSSPSPRSWRLQVCCYMHAYIHAGPVLLQDDAQCR